MIVMSIRLDDPVIAIDSGALTVKGTSLESTICAVKLDEPADVGVPEMAPALKVRPLGSEPPVILHLSGAVPPLTVSALL